MEGTIVSMAAKAERERPAASGVKKVAATGMGSLMPEEATSTDIMIFILAADTGKPLVHLLP